MSTEDEIIEDRLKIIDGLRKENVQLKERISKLERRLNLNSQNSSNRPQAMGYVNLKLTVCEKKVKINQMVNPNIVVIRFINQRTPIKLFFTKRKLSTFLRGKFSIGLFLKLRL
jgi:hypothetical protein